MVILGRLLALFAVVLYSVNISAQQPDSTFWVPNGPVHTMLLRDTTVIIGGDFDLITPVTGAFIRIDTNTAQINQSLAKVNGTVYATCRDDDGYIYVGGDFSRIGNTQAYGILRLNPDGTYDPTFNHSVLGTVYCLAAHDTAVFLGGDFISIDGEARNNFGNISVNIGAVGDCNPNVNGPVYCCAPDPSTGGIIIGGDFTEVGTYSPPFLAKVHMGTGAVYGSAAVPWTATPNANGPVFDVEISGVRCYIAGEFNTFGNTSRIGLASLLNSSGGLLSENGQVNGPVYAIECVDTCVYIGGNFTSVDAQARKNFACLDQALNVRAINPGANGIVRTIKLIDRSRLFVGGDFTIFSGDTCMRGAIFHRAVQSIEDWNPQLNGTVYTAVLDTSLGLYIGGAFFGAAGVTRNNLCAISINTGLPTAWNPDVNATVNTMTLDGDSLYFAGDFSQVGGSPRGKMAAIDLLSGSLLPFNPVVIGLVRTIVVTDTFVYAGGNFTSFGGQLRGNIGKVYKSTGVANPWHPNCLGTVNSILVSPNWIYVAGFYNTISGVTRENLSRINPYSAYADQNWICDVDGGIYHAEFYNNSLAVAGWFDNVNAQYAPDFAIVDTTTLQTAPMSFGCDGFIRTFTNYGDDFFFSGNFQLVNTLYRPKLVAFDLGDDVLEPWAPLPDVEALTMQASATRLFLGGSMKVTAGRFHPYFQVMDIQWVTPVEEMPVSNLSLQAYPNPTTDFVKLNGVENYSGYTVCDLSGAVVQRGVISGTTAEISLQNLAAGMYVLTLSGPTVLPTSQILIRQ